MAEEIESVLPYPEFNTLLVTMVSPSEKRILLYQLDSEKANQCYDSFSFCDNGFWRMLNRKIIFFEGDEESYVYNIETRDKIHLCQNSSYLLFPFGNNDIVGISDTDLSRWRVGSKVVQTTLNYKPSTTGRFWDLKVTPSEIWVPSANGLVVFDGYDSSTIEWPVKCVIDVLFMERSNHIQIRHNPKITDSVELLFDSFFLNLRTLPFEKNVLNLISKLESLNLGVEKLKSALLDSNLNQSFTEVKKDNILSLNLGDKTIFRYKILNSGYVSLDLKPKICFSKLSDLRREATQAYRDQCLRLFISQISFDKIPITHYDYYLFHYRTFSRIFLDKGEDTGRINYLTQIINDQYRIYSPDLNNSVFVKTKKMEWIDNESYIYLDSNKIRYIKRGKETAIILPYGIKDFVYRKGILVIFSQNHFKVIDIEKI